MRQVWQADDGRVFASSDECEQYEKSGLVISTICADLVDNADAIFMYDVEFDCYVFERDDAKILAKYISEMIPTWIKLMEPNDEI